MHHPEKQSERRPEAGAPAAYPRGVGGKFNIDGSVRRFPGNTIICHLPAESVLYAELLELHRQLKHSALAPLYTLLPPSSWHMTVFEGVCDEVRGPGYWPADLSPEAPLASCDALFSAKLSTFDAGIDPPLQLTVTGFQPGGDGISLRLEPATAAEEAGLRDLRDRLSRLLQIRHPGHDSYVFHLSIAYLTRYPTPAQRGELAAILQGHLPLIPAGFQLGMPEFCRFEDMFAFRRQFFLQRAGVSE